MIELLLLALASGAKAGLSFSYARSDSAWSLGYPGAILYQDPITRFYEFEHPGSFVVHSLHRWSEPLLGYFSGNLGAWGVSARASFSSQGDTLTSDRITALSLSLTRWEQGPWSWSVGASYSDFSYRQHIAGIWSNWTLDTRTITPFFTLRLAGVSTTLRAGYATPVSGEVLLPVELNIQAQYRNASFFASLTSMGNSASRRSLGAVGGTVFWKMGQPGLLSLQGVWQASVGGDSLVQDFSCTATASYNTKPLTLMNYLRALSLWGGSPNQGAIQEGLYLVFHIRGLDLISRPRITYYSPGDWVFGAMAGPGARLPGETRLAFLAGREDYARGFNLEAQLEKKLW